MTSLWLAAIAGVAAGFGVAVPLGAIGVLLVQEGLRSWRRAAVAAAAVATIDGLYAAGAVLLGPLIAAPLRNVEAWARFAAAVVLAAIAVRGLLVLRRPRPETNADETVRVTGPAWRVFARFAALTAINPTTALYFAALTTAQATTLDTAAAATAFALGAFAASLLWQQSLAAASAFAGPRLPTRAWPATHAAGYGLVLTYAVFLAWPLP